MSACDSCRRRKVKCDSKQPCQRCIDSGLECSYGSGHRRGLATTYVRTLEQQIAELQRQIQATAHGSTTMDTDSPASSGQGSPAPPPQIDLLVQSGGDLILQQPGGARIYRFSAALNILRTIGDTLDPEPNRTSLLAPPGVAIIEAIDVPLQIIVGDKTEWLDVVLPSHAEVRRLVSYGLDQGLVCHHCMDAELFQSRVDALYDPANMYVTTRNKPFMSVLYGALALGMRYSAREQPPWHPQLQPDALPPGFQYFRASRCISDGDLAACELEHVLGRIMQARYLLSVSHVSEAHSTLCKAISVATHMGLHFDDSALHGRYSDAELEQRRMAFAVLYMMDVYLSFILGLPRTLSFAHPKQTLGLRGVDMHDEGRSFITRDPSSSLAETIMSQKIFHIYAKIVDHQSIEMEDGMISSDWVREIQDAFTEWETMLPEFSADSADKRALLGQITLRMQYSGAQIVLYAPCIHHLARDRSDPNFNIDGFAYGSDCVRAAAQYILLVDIINTQNVMVPTASWMMGFILTFATSVLTYFVMNSKTRVTIEENKQAIMTAGRTLAMLGENSESSKRIHNSLSPYLRIVLGDDP